MIVSIMKKNNTSFLVYIFSKYGIATASKNPNQIRQKIY